MSEQPQNIPVEEKADDKVGGTFRSIEHTLGRFRTEITRLQAQLKSLEKEVNREVKGLKREAVKGKNRGNRQPSGFAKPSAISDELCDFMEKEHGSLVARTDVTRHIIQYIKEKGLNDSRTIHPDEKLKSLLGVKDEDVVTYFNIQRLMNPHFVSQSASS